MQIDIHVVEALICLWYVQYCTRTHAAVGERQYTTAPISIISIAKRAGSRLKQCISPDVTILLLMRSNKILPISTYCAMLAASYIYMYFNLEFCFIGTIISSDLRDNPDINRRVQQASKAFGSLRSSVFCNRK